MASDSSYKKLLVWQRAKELTLIIYKETSGFPKQEAFGITSQLRRAATSVIANIAEGYERQHRKEYIQFLFNAKGSLAEVEVYLDLSKDLCYFNEQQFEVLSGKQKEVGKLLNALINSLKS
ncbi:MAG: four helix bundle protein [Candidatus Aquicultor sp.]